MSVEKMSIKQVADVIRSEGLGYSVQNYIDPESIEDETLSRLWGQAEEVLGAIEGFMVAALGEDWGDV